jgi:hypothetical protein
MPAAPIRIYTGALALLTFGTGAFGVLERSRADAANAQAARWQRESRDWDALAAQAVAHDRGTVAWAQATTARMERETGRAARAAERSHRTLALALRRAQRARRAEAAAAAATPRISFTAGGGGSYGAAPAPAAVVSAPTTSAS